MCLLYAFSILANVDNIDPVIYWCLTDISVAIPLGFTGTTISWPEPTATDNSGSTVGFTSTSSPGDTFNVGTTQVTYTFVDGSGNDAFCSFFVTVAGMFVL